MQECFTLSASQTFTSFPCIIINLQVIHQTDLARFPSKEGPSEIRSNEGSRCDRSFEYYKYDLDQSCNQKNPAIPYVYHEAKREAAIPIK